MKERLQRKIESEDNRVFKSWRKALSGRGIRKHGTALISGPKAVGDVLRLSPGLSVAWISTPTQSPPPAELPDHAAWYQLPPRLFRMIDVSGTGAPILQIETPPIPDWRFEVGFPNGCTLFVPFQDPENVGAVIRSAVAFGVGNVVLLAECASPYHPKALRASGGAVLQAALFQGPSINDLPDSLPVVALSLQGPDVSAFDFPEAFVLLPGIEGPGLPDRFRSKSVSIPIAGAVESLNAAAATAIALFLWSARTRNQEEG